MKISIGILSYNAPSTLKNTLLSYKNSRLIEETDDIFCILQNSKKQEEEENICSQFSVKSIKMPDNGLMASGFREIFNNAKNEIILFLENDFCTYCDQKEVKYYLENAIYFLNKNTADLVRGRSRKNPGHPNYAKMNLSQIPPSSFIKSKHLSECMYWVEHPELVYPDKITKIKEDWYMTSSASCNYTNNPYMCKKDFFYNAIYPYLKNGENIEKTLTPIWSQKNYKCIFGFGIFTHDRKDGH